MGHEPNSSHFRPDMNNPEVQASTLASAIECMKGTLTQYGIFYGDVLLILTSDVAHFHKLGRSENSVSSFHGLVKVVYTRNRWKMHVERPHLTRCAILESRGSRSLTFNVHLFIGIAFCYSPAGILIRPHRRMDRLLQHVCGGHSGGDFRHEQHATSR
jgi:hypothetical protein